MKKKIYKDVNQLIKSLVSPGLHVAVCSVSSCILINIIVSMCVYAHVCD